MDADLGSYYRKKKHYRGFSYRIPFKKTSWSRSVCKTSNTFFLSNKNGKNIHCFKKEECKYRIVVFLERENGTVLCAAASCAKWPDCSHHSKSTLGGAIGSHL
jgi:hypothetical protein